MSTFEEMKAKRQAGMNALTQAAKSVAGGEKSYEDDRFWEPSVDKAGNGYAVFRFLPAPAGEDLPWVRYWSHGFKGPTGRWYIENSLTSIGQQDYIGEVNQKLWNSGLDSDKKIARDQKRKLHYIVNVMVISDPAKPENNGKVMLFRFGKKIFDKILDLMQPQFPDEKPVNPFDLWEGADFSLKIRMVEGYRNYDKSEFSKPSPLLGGDDAKLEKIYSQLTSLKEFLDPKNYKTYDELKKKAQEVLGAGQPMSTAEKVDLEKVQDEGPRYTQGPNESRQAKNPIEDEGEDEGPVTPAATVAKDAKSDSLSYFAKLAQS